MVGSRGDGKGRKTRIGAEQLSTALLKETFDKAADKDMHAV